MRICSFIASVCGVTLAAGLGTQGIAAEANFAGKTVTVVISSGVGGGTDSMARLVGRYLREYLPGRPIVTFHNIPGAGGIKALNFFQAQAKPDGLTSVVGSASNLDPTVIRSPTVTYDTKKLMMYGGFPAPSGILMLRKDASKRFYDKSQPPAVIGNVNAVRTSDQMAVWGPAYLGWNIRWVLGYPSSQEINLAALRGETDMVITYERNLIAQLMETGNFVLVAQTGDVNYGKLVRSSQFSDTPIFADLVRPQLKNSDEIKAFQAWEALAQVGKWMALPSGTPPEILSAYRKAFVRMVEDPQFKQEAVATLGNSFTTASGEEMQQVALRADAVSEDTLKFFDQLRERVGIRIDNKK